MPDERPLRPGDPTRLGDYEITGRLGEGGQGVVYLAHRADPADSAASDEDESEYVAIKLLRAELTDDETARSRFLREAQAARRVARFCTAQLLEAGVDEGRPFIVSEYVPGPSLYALVNDEGVRGGAALERLGIGIATALVAIHQADIVHRDLKPHNVLLGPDGPRVIDFGVARALDMASTLTTATVGTPAYMSPEQVSGAEITKATDIFAWAATMVFAATGHGPFGHDTIPAVVHRILTEPADLGAIPEPLRTVVAQCLDKDPARRPQASPLLMRLLGTEDVATTAILAEGAATAILAASAGAAAAKGAEETVKSPEVATSVNGPLEPRVVGGTDRTLPEGAPASEETMAAAAGGRANRRRWVVLAVAALGLVLAGVVAGLIVSASGHHTTHPSPKVTPSAPGTSHSTGGTTPAPQPASQQPPPQPEPARHPTGEPTQTATSTPTSNPTTPSSPSPPPATTP